MFHYHCYNIRAVSVSTFLCRGRFSALFTSTCIHSSSVACSLLILLYSILNFVFRHAINRYIFLFKMKGVFVLTSYLIWCWYLGILLNDPLTFNKYSDHPSFVFWVLKRLVFFQIVCWCKTCLHVHFNIDCNVWFNFETGVLSVKLLYNWKWERKKPCVKLNVKIKCIVFFVCGGGGKDIVTDIKYNVQCTQTCAPDFVHIPVCTW